MELDCLNIIKKLFYNPAWVVACRKIEDRNNLIPNKTQKPFYVLLPTSKEWYADSFCFEYNGKCYLFMEIMGRNGSKGTLGVTKFENGKFSEVIEILREPFHLSYPNVFKHKDQVYMIPETNESNQIRLYECSEFPYNWKLKKVLFENVHLVDSSFLKITDDKYLVFSHDIKDNAFKLRVFIFDLNEMTFEEIEKFKSASDERPGGNIITINGANYRVLQDCSEEYGKRLKIYEITEFDLESMCYQEEFVNDINIEKISINIKKSYNRVHTLTRSENFEAIDSQYSRFYLFKPLRKIKSLIDR